jgi:hypothetical protein
VSGSVDQGWDQGTGIGVRAVGSGTGRKGRTGASRSGLGLGSAPGHRGRGVGIGLGWWRAPTWLVPGAGHRACAASTFGCCLGQASRSGRPVRRVGSLGRSTGRRGKETGG